MATKVKLSSSSLDETREFDIDHAERILQYQDKNGGDWKLTDTNFVYSDGIIKRANKGPDKNSKKLGESSESN